MTQWAGVNAGLLLVTAIDSVGCQVPGLLASELCDEVADAVTASSARWLCECGVTRVKTTGKGSHGINLHEFKQRSRDRMKQPPVPLLAA